MTQRGFWTCPKQNFRNNTFVDILCSKPTKGYKGLSGSFGGPVQPTALSYIYMPDSTSGSNVMDNLKVGHSLDDLIRMSRQATESSKLKIFAGYWLESGAT